MLKRIYKRKKGISLMVSYVLLVIIALGLAAGIYAWMRLYAPTEEEAKCDPNAALAIKNYDCYATLGKISLELENKGLFKLDGFFVRASNQSDGLITISLNTTDVSPSEVMEGRYNFYEPLLPNSLITANFSYKDYGGLSKIQIQPFVYGENKVLACENIITIDLESCGVTAGPSGGLDPTIKSWWTLDTDANDKIGTNNGVPSGVTFANNAAVFGGSDYITVSSPTDLDFGTGDFTISFWVKVGSDGNIINRQSSLGSGRWKIMALMGKIYFAKEGDTILTQMLNVDTTGNWQHIVIKRDGENGTICSDKDCSNSIEGYFSGSNLNTVADLIMGCKYDGTICLNGELDEVIIYKRALTQAEINALYDARP